MINGFDWPKFLKDASQKARIKNGDLLRILNSNPILQFFFVFLI